MSLDIRLPNINATTDAGQLQQIRTYLYQFAEQLQWAMNTLESGQSGEAIVQKGGGGSASVSTEEADAMSSFNEIKSLIIRSADIVDAYYEEIDKLISLSGKYVAESDFGTYKEETSNSISATNDSITQTLSRVASIESDVEGIKDAEYSRNSYIKYGEVGSAIAVDDNGNEYTDPDAVGIEIGVHFVLEDGTISETTKRYARFTENGLELFGDSLERAVAYVRKDKLYITNAEFSGMVYFGQRESSTVFEGYRVDTSNGLVFKWIGDDY